MTDERFRSLYADNWSLIEDVRRRCLDELGDVCPRELNGPYLLDPHDAYRQARTRVVFVGQETCGWPKHGDIAAQMSAYRDFELAKNYKKRSSPFWKTIRWLERKLLGDEHSCAVLNLNRFDVNKTRPRISVRSILAGLDFLLLHELNLLAPDVVVFFTGPLHGYDERLDAILPGPREPLNGFTRRQLCRIVSPQLPARIFRTYHPNHLQRSTHGNLSQVPAAIVNAAR